MEAAKSDDIKAVESTVSIGYDDYDGHFDDPADEENQLADNDDFIAFSNSESENDSETENEGKESVEGKKRTGDSNSNDTLDSDEETIVTSEYPWIINHDHSKQREVADWLTLEIHDFVSYISPNRIEIEARNKTISKIRNAVQTLWPDADLHVFGSYATDLYLPGSDIDCVVNSTEGNKDGKGCLYQLAKYLKDKKLATEVEVIAKTRVPIIKFVEPESKIHIDVSFERTNGLEAAKLIREWLDSTPGLRELVLVVKQFLHSRRLNNVHTGGLGGFSIICLVYVFLHLHPRIITNEIDPKRNLGVLLIEFFELYGKNFAYDDIAISTINGIPKYLPKANWKNLPPARSTFSLAIQDPGDSSNNISRGSFNIPNIKKALAGAFDLLTNRCFELEQLPLKKRRGKSILGNCIKYKGKQRDFKDERSLVKNKAIQENEDYHKKRTRSMDDLSQAETSSKEPPSKKRRKIKKMKKNKKTENTEQSNDDYTPML